MKNHFSNKKEEVNQITRFVNDTNADKLEAFGLARTGKEKTVDGEHRSQFVIFDDLKVEVPETFEEAIEVMGKPYMLSSTLRELVVDKFQAAVADMFAKAGIVTKRTEHVKKAISSVVKNVFLASGGKIGKDGVETSGCTLAGIKYETMLDLAKVIG